MYPKTMTSRLNNHAQVVVANEEQEAALPDEFRADGAIHLPAGTDTTAALLSPEYEALLAEREAFEKERTELAEARAKLEQDRAELTKGYKDAMASLDADRAAHKADVAAWNKAKEDDQLATKEAAETAAPATATAKRTRTAKE